MLDFPLSERIFIDYEGFRSSVAQLRFGEPKGEHSEGMIELNIYEYDLSRAVFTEEKIPMGVKEGSIWTALIMDIVMAFIVMVALIRRLTKESTVNTRISAK